MQRSITPKDANRLRSLEKIVANGQKTFLKVGSALKEIRDSKLYRATHRSFVAYAEERFGFKRRYAYYLIESSDAVQDSEQSVHHGAQIENERQARELAKAPAEKQQEVVDEAEKIADERGTKVTAKIVSEARKKVVQGEIVDDDDVNEVSDDGAEDEYEECGDEYEDVEEPQDTGRMSKLRTFVSELAEHELVTVRDWIEARMEDHHA
ncbi:hypothetical protein [Novipirellula artificiosorum]|uniref:Uncharacterized protein n=1 Tax=Novipirellula artificiosorum TaxID=2528016 RepID=A0A5C6DDN1_9BACT|nr:hypothetical protein [Novipirellula artificiosorum]TWU33887.1 hypothetical protein Poly41_48870 [Novipirellula artificiosorum]